MKKVSKDEPIAGLSIPQTANALQFRTKAKTLVATGYEKVRRDEDGAVRVYFKANQVNDGKLVQVEPGGTSLDRNPAPARYTSKDAAKVEFLRPYSPPVVFLVLTGHYGQWNAAAADLYVNGVAVYTPDSRTGPNPA
jgi:hypothetical protein